MNAQEQTLETGEEELPMEEMTLLGILSSQREDSVGFDNDKALNEARERALDYYKAEYDGYVKKDLPAGENRSTTVSSDVADAIETMLPDLVEIFTAGEDVVTFKPHGAEDEEQAKQETDAVREVIFGQNDGFMLFYAGIKDALLSRLGIWHYYWNAKPEYQEQTTEVWSTQLEELEAMGLEVMSYEPKLIEGQPVSDDMGELYEVTCRKKISDGHLIIETIAPEDFTVAKGTVTLRDTDYCAMKTRAKVQSLIADGYEEDKVKKLRAADDVDDERDARDLANDGIDTDNATHDMLREVEIVQHYIRLFDGDGEPQIWRIVTGNDEETVLAAEKRSSIEFAAITPYPMTHTLIGQSLADKQIGIQKWKTSVTRMLNDAGMYSSSQRQEVSFKEIIEGVTLEQLVDNQPGKPVVTQSGNGLRPIQTAPPAFDMLNALEYINTVSEQRTGSARNAQGLNPDTLHDTAKGAEQLMRNSQKRVRLMARLFAESGIKDLFRGVHDLLRSNASMASTVQLRGKWVEINPSSWKRRKDMNIDIGVGSGGRDHEIGVTQAALAAQGALIQMQGGLDGELVSKENVRNLNTRYLDKLGLNSTERFIKEAPDPNQQQHQQPPNPEMVKLQAEQKAKQAEMQAKLQMDQAKFQADQQRAAAKIASDEKIAAARMEQEMQLKREQAEREMQLARENAAYEAELARERMAAEFTLEREKMSMAAVAPSSNGISDVDINLTNNRPGGDLNR